MRENGNAVLANASPAATPPSMPMALPDTSSEGIALNGRDGCEDLHSGSLWMLGVSIDSPTISEETSVGDWGQVE
jgi:hypothetical protein